jgi:hypothetical protein
MRWYGLDQRGVRAPVSPAAIATILNVTAIEEAAPPSTMAMM